MASTKEQLRELIERQPGAEPGKGGATEGHMD